MNRPLLKNDFKLLFKSISHGSWNETQKQYRLSKANQRLVVFCDDFIFNSTSFYRAFFVMYRFENRSLNKCIYVLKERSFPLSYNNIRSWFDYSCIGGRKLSCSFYLFIVKIKIIEFLKIYYFIYIYYQN